ncbi:MAG: hypothetical protein ACOX88_09000 [Christensenellales bacterium]|jgi:hypothetical protein
MSFYAYEAEGRPCPSPGPITGDPTKGLCERTCVQVKKVFDSCMFQKQLDNVHLSLKDIEPRDQTFVSPLTFISCCSIPGKSWIEDLCITRFADRPNFARVRGVVHIPIRVVFEDCNGCEGIGVAIIQVPRDVILYVPDDSIIPFEAEAVASAICVQGSYHGDFKFCVTICVTVILKIVAPVELLIPSYGYCSIPPCEEFAAGVCDDFFSLPIFPPSEGCEC